MARQRHSASLNLKGALLSGLAAMIFAAGVSQTAWARMELSCTAMKLAVGTLSSASVQALHAMQAHPCAEWLLQAIPQLTQALWPVLLHIAAAL